MRARMPITLSVLDEIIKGTMKRVEKGGWRCYYERPYSDYAIIACVSHQGNIVWVPLFLAVVEANVHSIWSEVCFFPHQNFRRFIKSSSIPLPDVISIAGACSSSIEEWTVKALRLVEELMNEAMDGRIEEWRKADIELLPDDVEAILKAFVVLCVKEPNQLYNELFSVPALFLLVSGSVE